MSNISVFLTGKKNVQVFFLPCLDWMDVIMQSNACLDDIQSITHWILGYTEFCIFLKSEALMTSS